MRTSHLLVAGVVALGAALPAQAAAGPGAQAAPAAPKCEGVTATIVGTPERDELVGTPRRDVIVGLGGSDRIDALGGNDLVCGGTGGDRLIGGPGDDRVLGQVDGRYFDEGFFYYGDDLVGGPGDDVLVGGDERATDRVAFPTAVRGVQVDLLAGTATGQGEDVLRGIGAAGLTDFGDTLIGVREFANVDSLGGDDVVRTEPGWYGAVSTGTGADTVRGGGYGDVNAGPDDDVVAVGGASVWSGAGDDEITFAGPGGGYVQSGAGDDVVVGAEGDDQIETGAGEDAVRAGSGDDFVRDGTGDDQVDGGPGDDEIQGGTGADGLTGGRGSDEISYLGLYGGGGITLDLAAGTVSGVSGEDRVAGFERINGSPGNDEIYGSAGDEVIDGDEGRDVLHGRAGNDRLVVNFGAPEFHGDAGADVLVVRYFYGSLSGLSFDGGDGRDRLSLEAYGGGDRAGTIDLQAGQITDMGTAPIEAVEDVTDNRGPHTIIGDDGPNRFEGAGGDDVLVGNGGDDTLAGDAGEDSADGGAGTDACDAETVRACEG